MSFDDLRIVLPLFKSSGDWLALIPEGRLVIYNEFGQWHYNIQGRLPDGEAKVIQGGCEESLDDIAPLVWEGVQELRNECCSLRTPETLAIIKSFMDGPLRSYLEEGVSFSRFVELTNQTLGTQIKYSDLYPTWIFGAKTIWNNE